jgi:holliday junction DNA helicase RuvA
MIYFLNGVVDSKHLNSLVIDVSGIGYEVLVPTSVLSVVVHGEKRKLFTYQYVREDDLKLFGFLEAGDLEIFKLLISVNGIGPKAGLAILSGYSREDIVSAIQRADDRLFASVSGIGKKGAAKIVIELKGKVSGLVGSGTSHFQEELIQNTSNDLIDALVGLGYSEKEIYSHLKQVDGTKDLNGQIKQMLGLLGK